MDNDRLKHLFECYRKSSCTRSELEELNQWYETLHPGGEQIEEWIAEAGGESQLADQLYTNFSKIVKGHKKSRHTVRWYSVAAAVTLLATGLFFYKLAKERPVEKTILAHSAILPGTNRAILTLADGSQVDLDDSAEGKIYDKNGLTILKTDSGSLTYFTSSMQTVANDRMKYNSIYVPRGGQYKVMLPDGTKVWINSASTFKFPITSNGRNRLVSLTGEGYFEVAHNKRLPFKVRTADQEVQVLGTHFNIKGYDEEGLISTTLIEGNVKISKLSTKISKLLSPGQQADISKQKNRIDIFDVDIKQAIAWKNGYFSFDNQDIQSIMRAISRWYNIDVSYQNGISRDRFGGTFSRHSNLAEILDNLQELGDIHFTVKGRSVIVSSPRKI